MLDLIAFDADDTLWHNEFNYRQAKAQFVNLLSPFQESTVAEQRLDEIEEHNVRHYGYGIKSFSLSMIEAALELSGRRIPGKQIEQILAIAHHMLAMEVQLLENVEETLALLSVKYPLLLVTKGDTFEQEQKIARSGLRPYFRYVEVVGEKTVHTYRNLVQKYAVASSRFMMVGNSLRSDILPVVELGGVAVLIPYPDTWAHENNIEGHLPPGSYYELECLDQLPALLRQIERGGG